MTNVIFACLWYRDKKRTWSGTAWSLRQALDPYLKITDFTITDPCYRKVIRKLKKYKGLAPRPPLRDCLRLKKLCTARDARGRSKVFQFGDWPCGERYASYLYQDLSVSAILRLRQQDPQAYRYCEYDKVPLKELKRRAAAQLACYRQSEAVFTMSGWLLDHLVTECGIPAEKVYAVGGGINVDAGLIRPGKKENRRILFVGRNFVRKGGVIVVEAFRILREQYLPEAELYLAGASAEEIRGSLRQAGVPAEETDMQGICLVGEVKEEKLAEYYNLCDVFCMPSYFEAYGLVFAEALVFGLPCIGRDKFAMREIIEDGCTGKLFSGEDPGQLAEDMWELLTKSHYREEVARRRDRYLAEYSWDRVARRICDVMENNDRKRRNQDQYHSTGI